MENIRKISKRRTVLLIAILSILLPSVGSGNKQEAVDLYKVEAAFLRNFARYVAWPEGTFADDTTAWSIGILGEDPFGNILENTLEDRQEQGRYFKVYRSDSLKDLPPCQIVYIAYSDSQKCSVVLAELKELAILTVSEMPDFLEEGGIIQLQIADRVKMNINLDQARSVSLKIQTKMLEVAHKVIDGGAINKRRR
ncbi:MAG: YfiR family protein [Candidatus Zixiibacteriota bacterium]